MPSLTGGEMPRKMARVIKSVIEVNIRSRNSKSRTINSLLGCKETKKRTNSTMEKKWRFIVAWDDPTQSIHSLINVLNTIKFISDYVKFIYSEKVTKFCKIFTLLLTVCTVVKRFRKILWPSQNI